ncbi:hypothetical protein ANN_00250 [Periplaneta americana]|uniref:C2H2-type domain-containing protein n=1 Tax=Periplaneta americana TaxID=6978 RepID=A0ABQ8TQJ3_PERAM|nr:hypothetical protein ANN_00250 [Periplaneta americana]
MLYPLSHIGFQFRCQIESSPGIRCGLVDKASACRAENPGFLSLLKKKKKKKKKLLSKEESCDTDTVKEGIREIRDEKTEDDDSSSRGTFLENHNNLENQESESLKISAQHNRSWYNLEGEMDMDVFCDSSDDSTHANQFELDTPDRNLVQPSEDNSELRYFNCNTCGEMFEQTYILAHSLIDADENLYNCDNCTNSSQTEQSQESQTLIYSAENETYNCDVCKKTFRQMSHLVRHKFSHSRSKPHKCGTCGKAFVQKNSLDVHQLIHSGDGLHKCPVCDKPFSGRLLLLKHMLNHTGEKAHKCDICAKSFVNKRVLIQHKLIHNGEKPYKCEICGNSYRARSTLIKHSLTHTGDKPYKCNFCDQSFRHRYTLTDHVLIHTGEKPHKCDICGLFRFSIDCQNIKQAFSSSRVTFVCTVQISREDPC